MDVNEVASSRPPNEVGSAVVAREGGETVVWLRGEHDAATAAALSQTLLTTAGLGDGDLIVDLSGVQFMGAATVGVIVHTRALLRERLQMLTLRSPSSSARLVLELCGVAYAPEREPHAAAASATALGTWVAIPSSERTDRVADAGAVETTAVAEVRVNEPSGAHATATDGA